MKHGLLTLGLSAFFTLANAQTSQMPTTEVENYQGWYIFWPGQKPSCEFEYLGTLEPKVIKNFKASTLLNTFVKKAKEKFINGNAIVFKDLDLIKADIVKLKF